MIITSGLLSQPGRCGLGTRLQRHHTFDTPVGLETLRIRDGVLMIVAGTLTGPCARETGMSVRRLVVVPDTLGA
jgi:hypothetical protein